jgi:hypothetical protein
MEERKSRSTILLTIVAALFMAPMLVVAFVYFSSSVSGTTTLPSGVVARITGPFSASENAGRTTVEARGRQFVFTPAAISVDGTNVTAIDASILQVAIDARGYDAELSVNGKRVSLPPR